MLEQVKSVFIIGIKGVGMANLAVILKKMGKMVAGADTQEEQITDELLNKHNIAWTTGFESLPADVDAVVYSAAHRGDENPLVVEAQKRDIKVYHQAEFFDKLMKEFETSIAVCGSHGKTTTASLLSYALIRLGAKPSYLVGAPNFNDYDGGDYLGKDYFVLEADEYGINPPKDKTPKLHFLNPDYILCTNIDFDHPDVFQDLAHTKQEFEKFFKKAQKVIMCPENEDPTIDKHRSNEEGVKTLLLEFGFEEGKIEKAMAGFVGAKRRFEQKAYENDIYLFDDYAHHPREIEATIKKIRERFRGRRLIVLFQSHTYSRTKALLKEFGQTLALADQVLIGPIFSSARENPSDYNVSAFDMAAAANSNHVVGFASMDELLVKLKEIIKRGDIIFTMGAGDIYKLDHDIIKVIQKL